MIKSVGKFFWRIGKCVIGAAGVCFVGYYACLGLNWLTGNIMKFLTTAANYLLSNWIAIIWVVLALIVGGLAFDLIANAFRDWRARRANSKAQKKGRNLGDQE